MLFLFFAFVALTLTGWIMLASAAGCAPIGTEDEAGFRLVRSGLETDAAARGDAHLSALLRDLLDRDSMPVR